MTRTEAEDILQRRFGLQRFYDEQWEAIERILRGERILMIQRTGFGKSLCYQFPATLFNGITVIFSPLIALMRDQVKALQSKGIAAAYINSEQSPEDNQQAIDKALNGQLKILYIAPERQENEAWIEATRQMNLSMVVIDEAHTISTWGHDFRPAFRRIIDLVQLLPTHLPVLATTATATIRVQRDIERQIGGKLTTIRGSLVRDNLYLRVVRVQSEDEKLLWLAENLPKVQGTGLIYTGTRVDTEIYAKWLNYNNISTIDYNAGFDARHARRLKTDSWQIVGNVSFRQMLWVWELTSQTSVLSFTRKSLPRLCITIKKSVVLVVIQFHSTLHICISHQIAVPLQRKTKSLLPMI